MVPDLCEKGVVSRRLVRAKRRLVSMLAQQTRQNIEAIQERSMTAQAGQGRQDKTGKMARADVA